MHFHQRSPYLCEAFHLMTTSTPPRPSRSDWGSILYLRLGAVSWQTVFHHLNFYPSPTGMHVGSTTASQTDPSNGRWTGGLMRVQDSGLDRKLSNVLAVHLHDQCDQKFPPYGWVDRLLVRRYEKKLSEEGDW